MVKIGKQNAAVIAPRETKFVIRKINTKSFGLRGIRKKNSYFRNLPWNAAICSIK